MMNAQTTKGDATAHSPIAIASKIIPTEITAGNIRMAHIPINTQAGPMMTQESMQITIDNPRARNGSIKHPIEIITLTMAHPIIPDAIAMHTTSKIKHSTVRMAHIAHPTQHNPDVRNMAQVKVRQMHATMQAAHKIIDPTPQNIMVGIRHINAPMMQIIEIHIETEQHIRDIHAIAMAHAEHTITDIKHTIAVNPQIRHVIQAIIQIIHGKIQHNISNPPHTITMADAIRHTIQNIQHGIVQIRAKHNAVQPMRHTIEHIIEHIDPNTVRIVPAIHEIMQSGEHIITNAPHNIEIMQIGIKHTHGITHKTNAQRKSNAHHIQQINPTIMNKQDGRRHINDGMIHRHPIIVMMQHIGQYKMAQKHIHAIIRQMITIIMNNNDISMQRADDNERA